MGDVHFQCREHERALEMYEGYLRRVPNSSDGFCKLGECYRAMGAIDAARASYTCALKIDPGHAVANQRLAALQGPLANPTDRVTG